MSAILDNEIKKLKDLEQEFREHTSITRALRRRIISQKECVYTACHESGGHKWIKGVCSGPRDNGEFYYTCTRCGLS